MVSRENRRKVSKNSGPEKGVIMKGVFTLEKSLESLNSLESLESLENGLFWKDPFSKRPLFRTRKTFWRFLTWPLSTGPSCNPLSKKLYVKAVFFFFSYLILGCQSGGAERQRTGNPKNASTPLFCYALFKLGDHSGDHNHQDFPKSTAVQMGGVLQYKWEAYCNTNGGSTDSISLSSERRGTKSTAVQIGGVLQYKWEAYCDTFSRSGGGSENSVLTKWGFLWDSTLRNCLRKSSENRRVECKLQSEIPFSSTNFSAKSHFQIYPSKMSPFSENYFDNPHPPY